jgi:predicted PurR-regulated permease PerM
MPRYRDHVADADPPVRPERTRQGFEYVGLSAGSAALLVGAVVTAVLLADVFDAAHRTFGWVAACSVVALLIDPAVALVDRALPRVLAIIVVLLTVAGVIALVGVGVVREATDSLDQLVEEAPQAAAELEDRYDWAEQANLAQRVSDTVEELDTRIRSDALSQATDAAPAYLVTTILMLFLLAYGKRYANAFCDQFGEPRRSRLRVVLFAAARRGRRWLLGSLLLAAFSGTAVAVTAWWLGLPAVVSLGVLAGLLSTLPLIGVLVGGVPAALLALGFDGWPSALVVGAVLVTLQLFEAIVYRPWLERRSVRVGPTFPLVVGLLGFELYGVGGALYGIALAVIGLAALDAAGQAGALAATAPLGPSAPAPVA